VLRANDQLTEGIIAESYGGVVDKVPVDECQLCREAEEKMKDGQSRVLKLERTLSPGGGGKFFREAVAAVVSLREKGEREKASVNDYTAICSYSKQRSKFIYRPFVGKGNEGVSVTR